jgi:hypothetical protein
MSAAGLPRAVSRICVDRLIELYLSGDWDSG